MGQPVNAAVNLLREVYPVSLNSVEVALFTIVKGSWNTKSKTPKRTMDARLNTYKKRISSQVMKSAEDLFVYNPPTGTLWAEERHDSLFIELLGAMRRVVALNFAITSLTHSVLKDLRPKDEHIRALKGAAVIFAVAAWETFNEALVRRCSESLVKNLTDREGHFAYQRLPKQLLKSSGDFWASKHMRSKGKKSSSHVWKRNTSHKRHVIIVTSYHKQKTREYNNPNTKDTDALMRRCFCILKISAHWAITGYESKKACDELDRYVDIRHKFAHGESDERVDKVCLEKMLKFFLELAHVQYKTTVAKVEKLSN